MQREGLENTCIYMCVCVCVCAYVYMCVHVCFTIASSELVHSRSEISIYWINWQIEARKDRLDRAKGKNETCWLGEEGEPTSKIFSHYRKETERRSQCGCPVKLGPSPNPSITFIATCNHCSWSSHLGFQFLTTRTASVAVDFPYDTNPGNSFWLSLKQVTPLPGCN